MFELANLCLVKFGQIRGLFFFGRDANIIWQHGINALPEDEQAHVFLFKLCVIGKRIKWLLAAS